MEHRERRQARLAGIDARPELELVGVWVSNPDKVGKDAGRLAGLDRDLGVTATNDADALLALRPDCIVHTAMADDRLFEAIDDLEASCGPGINVVSSSPVFLQFPYGTSAEMAEPVRQAAPRAGVDLGQRHRPRLRQRLAPAAADQHQRADRPRSAAWRS